MAVLSAMLGLVGLFVAFGPYLYHALACLRWAKANGVLASAGGALLDWFGVHCGDERSFYVALASVTLRGFEDVAAVWAGDGSIEDGLLVVLEVCQHALRAQSMWQQFKQFAASAAQPTLLILDDRAERGELPAQLTTPRRGWPALEDPVPPSEQQNVALHEARAKAGAAQGQAVARREAEERTASQLWAAQEARDEAEERAAAQLQAAREEATAAVQMAQADAWRECEERAAAELRAARGEAQQARQALEERAAAQLLAAHDDAAAEEVAAAALRGSEERTAAAQLRVARADAAAARRAQAAAERAAKAAPRRSMAREVASLRAQLAAATEAAEPAEQAAALRKLIRGFAREAKEQKAVLAEAEEAVVVGAALVCAAQQKAEAAQRRAEAADVRTARQAGYLALASLAALGLFAASRARRH